MTKRKTTCLDKKLVQRIRRFGAPSGLNLLISEPVDEEVRQLERVEIEAALRKGYLSTKSERRELNADWQVVDGEGWPV